MIAISIKPEPPHLHSSDSDNTQSCVSSQSQIVAPNRPPALSRSTEMFASPSSSSTSTTTTILHDTSSKVTKRPKLSLQTSSLPVTFGKSTTALSVATVSAGCSPSPTVRNTFSNAYDGFFALSSPGGNSIPSLPTYASRHPKRANAYVASSNNTINTQSSKDNAPYQLPLGVRSILRNSPLRTSSRRTCPHSGTTANGATTARKILFPATKRVSYRIPLDEEIKTVRFIARHSDLSSSDESSSCPSDTDSIMSSSDEESDSSASHSGSTPSDDEAPGTTIIPSSDNTAPSTHRRRQKAKRKNSASERQIRAAALRDGLINVSTNYRWDNTPQTPQLQRCKKRLRKWRWTLGPIENGHVQPLTPSAGGPSLAATPCTTMTAAASTNNTPLSLQPSQFSVETGKELDQQQSPPTPAAQPPPPSGVREARELNDVAAEARHSPASDNPLAKLDTS
ncbi:hypothetical protein AJ80_09319 [Polytolypa hystricis UAMH7299]|uniref:Uncharacterized protein n=1 Tax=Polytolypa hystricis (strain UAMH7299) TaxID=1447883 RepID=A0A2B7WSJ5_POLH7|nr:hypothetical protein AJ80_09319 [Polytolypa hystricis UAMH7299]